MAFDKEKYWKLRNNKETVEVDGKKTKVSKPLRGQGNKPKARVIPNPDSDVEMGFDDNGKLVAKTRAWKRRHFKLRTKHLGIPPRKLAEHRKKQAARKRREARALKKEKVNG